MSDTNPVHSPLGASSAERWMNCPGSVAINRSIVPLPEPADPEYRKEGTAAHAAIAYCMSGSGLEAWEVIGETFEGVTITEDIANPIQVFLDECNALAKGADVMYVEEHMKGEHALQYGTVDFAAIKEGTLYVRDYKHGMGVVVETHRNPQMMYYAHLVLLRHPDVRCVNMRIVQPRLPFALDEPWETTAEEILEWAEGTLLPAMKRTETDTTLCPGEHCRFCEAKAALACPALIKLTAEFEVKPTVEQFPDDVLVQQWAKVAAVKMHLKAIEDETLRRLMDHKLTDNGVVKLVNKKANRVWKPEAPELFKSRFGDKVWNPPEFKSPAEMEKLGPDVKKMVHEYAYTPQSGYTVATIDDKRPGVVLKKPTEQFAEALDTFVE